MSSLKQIRYQDLRGKHFTPKEARELSTLPKETPALKIMKQEREARWNRFEKIASNKLYKGQWKRKDLPSKWLKNLSRMYTKNKWRVQEGPKGKQDNLGAKGSPNPWAAYRSAEKEAGGPKSKGYVSPWEVKQISHGKTKLQKGLIFVQRKERQVKVAGNSPASRAQIKVWIEQKEEAIREAKGRRKAQLIIERNRLEKML